MRWITALVTGAMFMEILDGSIIATALPDMARSFDVAAVRLNIGISAYLLALGVFIPASGWVAERFGARRVFSAAIALFTLSSALCGSADSLSAFVAIRVIQGVSGAMMVPVGRLVVLKHTPQEQLMTAIATLVWPALIAPVLGPPLGGFITTHFGWRWIFYLNVPLGVLGLIATLALVPNVREERRRPFDWPGFLLCGAGMFALLSGFEQLALAVDGIGLALVGGGVLVLLLALAHFRRAAAPMLDFSVTSITTFRTALRGGSLFRMGIGAAPFLLPLLFQEGFGLDPFHSGLMMLAVFCGNLGMKSVTNRILRKIGYRPVMIGNGLLAAVALAACAGLDTATPLALTIAVLVVGGMTRSMQFSTLGTIAFADMPKERMSDANSLFNTVSQVSMAAGITLGAIGIHLGGLWAGALGLSGPAAPYRFAFLLVAVVALLGQFDALRLPRDAGDRFAGRS